MFTVQEVSTEQENDGAHSIGRKARERPTLSTTPFAPTLDR